MCAYGEVVLLQGKSDLCNRGGGQETGKPEWLLSYASRNSVVIHHIHYRDFSFIEMKSSYMILI